MSTNPPDLGNQVSEYRGQYVSSFVIAAIFLVLALLAGIPGIISWGRGDAADASTLFCLGAIPALLGAAALLNGFVARKRRITVYEKGLVDQRMMGQTVTRWDEIAQVTYQPPNVGAGVVGIFALGVIGYLIAGGAGTNLVMALKNGKKITITRNIDKMPALARQVQDYAADTLFPTTKERFETAGSLSYGSFLIDKDGLRLGNNALKWVDVERIEHKGKNLEIYAAGKDKPHFSISLNAYSNGYVFKRLVEYAHAQSKVSPSA